MLRSPAMQMLSVCFALLLSLSLTAPTEAPKGTIGFSKRASALNDLWRSIPATQKAAGDSALHFKIDATRTDAWGITYLYGCTAIMISQEHDVLVAHMQEGNSDKCLSISDKATVDKWIAEKLEPATDLFDPNEKTRVDLLYSATAPNPRTDLIETFLKDVWDYQNNFNRWRYTPQGGTGESDGPEGKAVIQWTTPGPDGGEQNGRLRVWWGTGNGEDPIRNDVF